MEKILIIFYTRCFHQNQVKLAQTKKLKKTDLSETDIIAYDLVIR